MPTIAMEAMIDLQDNCSTDGILDIEKLKKYCSNDKLYVTDLDSVDNIVLNRFLNVIDGYIHDTKDILIERFEHICSQSPNSAKFMYENGVMEGYVPEEGIRSALKHGTLAIGQLGLAETLQILFKTDHTSERGMSYAKMIESLFEKRCSEFKKEYKLNFGVYYTPKLLGGIQVTV